MGIGNLILICIMQSLHPAKDVFYLFSVLRCCFSIPVESQRPYLPELLEKPSIGFANAWPNKSKHLLYRVCCYPANNLSKSQPLPAHPNTCFDKSFRLYTTFISGLASFVCTSTSIFLAYSGSTPTKSLFEDMDQAPSS